MDATRPSTNELVAIKSFRKQGQELHIAQFFSTIEDSQNHCVPVHEILPDPLEPQLALMVMPYLRPCNNPEFATIGDVVQFVDQTVDVSSPGSSHPSPSYLVRRDCSSCTSTM